MRPYTQIVAPGGFAEPPLAPLRKHFQSCGGGGGECDPLPDALQVGCVLKKGAATTPPTHPAPFLLPAALLAVAAACCAVRPVPPGGRL